MSELVTTLTIVFVLSAMMLFLANRFSQPAIPAYIFAGVVAGVFIQPEQIINLAQLGIAFLVFIFGVKFDPEKLLKIRRQAIAVNLLQVVLVGILSFSVAYIFGLNLLQSAFFSVAATFSSSLVGLELLSGEVDRNLIHGRLSEAIHLIQDMLAVIALVVLASPNRLTDITYGLENAALLIVAALLVRRYIFDMIGSLSEGSRELLMITGLSFLAGAMAFAEYRGLSIAVASFAAGIAVARFPYNLEILDTLGSVKDFFAAIFFVALGVFVQVPGPGVLFLTAALIGFTSFVKPALFTFSLIHQGYDPRTSFLTAVDLDQVSEFSLIIAIQAWISGIIIEPLFQAIILSAAITMTTSAYTKTYQNHLFELMNRYNIIESSEKILPRVEINQKLENHVVLLGYDKQGKRIAEELSRMDQEFLVVENDPEKISEIRQKHENFIYGNVIERETLESARIDEADLIISTIPVETVSERLLRLDTETDVILRTDRMEEAAEYIERGALYVIVPELLTSELVREHLIGMKSNENYKEELRRRNLLEVRNYLQDEEG